MFKRITTSLSGLSADRYLLIVVLSLVVLSFANLLFCAMGYEFGLSPNASILCTGPQGPTDRFADLVKISFSYRSFAQGIYVNTFESWPNVFKSYYIYPIYGGKEALAAGNLTHFHAPPLMTLLFLASAAFIVRTQSIWLDILLFYCLYLATVQWAIRVGIPREQRTGRILLVTWLFALLSYPSLMVVSRGNFHSGCTSMLIMAFLLSLFVRKRVGFAALLSLALAVNLRPNAGLFVLALPLLLGLKPSLKPLLRFAALAAGILACTYLATHALYPDYTVSAFLQGLAIYKRLYIIGNMGAQANSSLMALIKNYGIITEICYRPGLFVGLTAILFASIFWGASRAANRILAAPLFLFVLYAEFLFFAHAPDALTVTAGLSALLVGVVCLGLWRDSSRVLAPFCLTALYCLLCPVFADYHLLVFLAPLLILLLNEREWAGNHRILSVVGFLCVLMLSPKNYIFVDGISLQTLVNPLLLCFGIVYLVKETFSLPEPAAAQESNEALTNLEIAREPANL